MVILTPLTPGSPGSWTPLRFASNQTRSPIPKRHAKASSAAENEIPNTAMIAHTKLLNFFIGGLLQTATICAIRCKFGTQRCGGCLRFMQQQLNAQLIVSSAAMDSQSDSGKSALRQTNISRMAGSERLCAMNAKKTVEAMKVWKMVDGRR